MPDPTSVSNEALGELGAIAISSFEDGTSLSTLCAQMYTPARDMTLELHPWNFAKAFARLSQVDRPDDAPVSFKWAFEYQLMTDPYCLKVQGTDQGNGAKFEVGIGQNNARVLFSNQSAVSIEYTARVEDLNMWSPLALQVLVKVLASKLAKPITGEGSTEEAKWKEALLLLPEARGSDGREGYPVVLRANRGLVHARLGVGRVPW
jgi:hypothetical protein